MTTKTLGGYLELLKPHQQDYIVYCVVTHSDKPDFHRGLLPFLSCEEAARCLEYQLEHIKQTHSDPNLADKAVLGEKFIRQTISIFRNSLIYRLSEDEQSEVLSLDSVKLKKSWRYRYGKKFFITLDELGIKRKKKIEGMFELQMISRNRWKVTGHKDYFAAVAGWLIDEFAYFSKWPK